MTFDLEELIGEKNIVICGAGSVAKRFYYALERRGLAHRVLAFAVSESKKKENGLFLGKPVLSFSETAECRRAVYFLAVHESIVDEVQKSLKNEGILDSVWISPYLKELLFGKPLQYGESRNPQSMLHALGEKHIWYAIRYYAIESWYQRTTDGWVVYEKTSNDVQTEATTKERIRRFEKVIIDWDKNGYDEESMISVDEENRLIDGSHRLSLALYHGVPSVRVIEYSSLGHEYESVIGKAVSYTLDDAYKAGCSDKQLSHIEEIQNKLWQ